MTGLRTGVGNLDNIVSALQQVQGIEDALHIPCKGDYITATVTMIDKDILIF